MRSDCTAPYFTSGLIRCLLLLLSFSLLAFGLQVTWCIYHRDCLLPVGEVASRAPGAGEEPKLCCFRFSPPDGLFCQSLHLFHLGAAFFLDGASHLLLYSKLEGSDWGSNGSTSVQPFTKVRPRVMLCSGIPITNTGNLQQPEWDEQKLEQALASSGRGKVFKKAHLLCH